ncbi:MAG: hypothetical protein OEY11_13120 [Gammaproteobacteria bacterium]|nr:hypothetical protein [Gammaproteobacteria bacterium]
MSKIKKYLSLFVFLSILGCGFLYFYYFPSLNQDAVKYLFHDANKVKNENNFVFHLAGMHAPMNAKDIHGYGYKRYQNGLEKYTNLRSIEEDSDLPVIKNRLELEVDGLALKCWLFEVEYDDVECYRDDEVKNIIYKNQILLSRYKQSFKYSEIDSHTVLNPKITEFMGLQILFLSEKKQELRNGFDKELVKEVIEEFKLYQNILSSETTLVEKAIFMVMHGISREFIHDILSKYPNEVRQIHNEIEPLLSNFNEDNFNIPGMYRKEFALLNSGLCVTRYLKIESDLLCHPASRGIEYASAYAINDFYQYYFNNKDIILNNMNDITKICNEKETEQEIKNKDFDFLIHYPLYPYYPIYSVLKDGMLKGCRVIENMKSSIARSRALKLIIDINFNKISKDNISYYLKNVADKEYLSGKSYQYDSVKKVIKFPEGLPEFVYNREFKIFN